MTELEHWIEWSPAYDRRDPEPSKDYGIHGVECYWFVRGPRGAVQFLLYTNWMLPHVQEEQDRWSQREFPHLLCHPMPADLGFHSPVSTYKDQGITSDDCPIIHRPCYFDGSGLRAQKVYELLISAGGDAVWEFLDNEYYETFEKQETPEPEGPEVPTQRPRA